MASFSPHIAPDSLESVLNSLQALLDHNQRIPQHALYNSNAPHYAVHEPFSNQPAEQYDDPLVLEEIAPCPVYEVVKRNIPVLKNVVHPNCHTESLSTAATADMEKTLHELHALLSDIVNDIMLDAREHLQDQDTDSQEVMEISLKHFLRDLTNRLPH